MKTVLLIACGALVTVTVLAAQSSSRPRPYKVVFDLTSDNPANQAAVLRWLREVESVNPETDMEVVMYARGLALVKAETPLADEVKQAIGRPHVSFKVCAMAMRNQQLDKSQLLPNVAIVPDGIEEIVVRQREGWGYIKAVVQ